MKTTGNSSAAVYLTVPVIVKFMQAILGIVCVGIATHDLVVNFEDLSFRSATVIAGHKFRLFEGIANLFGLGHAFIDQLTCRIVFLTVSTIFLVISLIQLTWFPASLFTGELKSRIISGVIYHFAGFAGHLSAALFLRELITFLGTRFYNADMMLTVAIIGFANAALYLLSGILALFSFVGDNIFDRKSKPRDKKISYINMT